MSRLSTESYGKRLVDWLIEQSRLLNDNSDSKRSRAARGIMAELRHGVEDPLRIAKHVAPHLPEPESRADEEREVWLYTIAALFAWHRDHEQGVSLGDAFRRIQDKSDSTEGRFLALLTARRDHLESRLRHAVRLLAGKSIPLDWQRLTDDVLNWDDEGRPRQHWLARDFYRQSDTTDSQDAPEGPA